MSANHVQDPNAASLPTNSSLPRLPQVDASNGTGSMSDDIAAAGNKILAEMEERVREKWVCTMALS